MDAEPTSTLIYFTDIISLNLNSCFEHFDSQAVSRAYLVIRLIKPRAFLVILHYIKNVELIISIQKRSFCYTHTCRVYTLFIRDKSAPCVPQQPDTIQFRSSGFIAKVVLWNVDNVARILGSLHPTQSAPKKKKKRECVFKKCITEKNVHVPYKRRSSFLIVFLLKTIRIYKVHQFVYFANCRLQESISEKEKLSSVM